jgi:hypothetical protein
VEVEVAVMAVVAAGIKTAEEVAHHETVEASLSLRPLVQWYRVP